MYDIVPIAIFFFFTLYMETPNRMNNNESDDLGLSPIWGAPSNDSGEVRVSFMSKDEVHSILESNFQYYPSIGALDFGCAITSKKEFYDLRQEPLEGKTMSDMCPTSSFPKLKTQEIVRNYMRPETPYMSLLVFHGLGTGKTCLSIQVGEAYKPIIERTGKRNLVILSKSIEQNYYKELYSFAREKKEREQGLSRGSLQCTGTTYAPSEHLTRDLQEQAVLQEIKRFYEIKTYDFIKKRFFRIAEEVEVVREKSMEAANKLATNIHFVQRLQREFSNRLIIVDEIHNMRNSENEDEKVGSQILQVILKLCTGIKLLLLTATPIYNDVVEIDYLLTLLRTNEDKTYDPSRAENKVIFDTTLTVNNFKDEGERKKFMNLWRGYVSYVRGSNPINFPTKSFDKELTYEPRWKRPYIESGTPQEMRPMPLTLATMSPFQKEVYLGEKKKKKGSFDHDVRNISNIVYPLPQGMLGYGQEGFHANFLEERGAYVMTAFAEEKIRKKEFFMDAANIRLYSPKMDLIWKQITKYPKQLVFVYAELKYDTVIPFCLFLEYNGFQRFSGRGAAPRPMLKTAHKASASQPIRRYMVIHGDIPVEERSAMVAEFNRPENKEGAEVQVIIGTRVMGEGIDLKNTRQIHIFNPWYNMSRIDQIIGRGVRHCSHLDFADDSSKRDVKIYLYSASLYDKNLKEATPEQETVDEWVFREASTKDILFQRIFKALRQVAFDCTLNKEINFFATDADNSRECAYEKCENKCVPECAARRINNDTYDLSLNVDGLARTKTDIIAALRSVKRAFTVREILQVMAGGTAGHFPMEREVLRRVQDMDMVLFSSALLQLVQDGVVINSGVEYVLPRRGQYLDEDHGDRYIDEDHGDEDHGEKRELGLEYLLHGDETGEQMKAQPLSEMGVAERCPKRVVERNVSSYDIEKWLEQNIPMMREISEHLAMCDERLRFFDEQGKVLSDSRILYRFIMNLYKFPDIFKYFLSACLAGRLEEYAEAFPYLLFDERDKVWKFYDLSTRQLYFFDPLRASVECVANQTKELADFVTAYQDRAVIRQLARGSIDGDEWPFLKNLTHGYIQSTGGEYKFLFVPRYRHSTRSTKHEEKGRVCDTYSVREIDVYVRRLAKELIQRKSGRNSGGCDSEEMPLQRIKKMTAGQYCVMLQYLLFQLGQLNRETIYLYEVGAISLPL